MPRLSPSQVADTVEERFRLWGRRLKEQRATPLLVLGLTSDADQFTLNVCEGMPNAQILEMLDAAAAMMRAGLVDDHSTTRQ